LEHIPIYEICDGTLQNILDSFVVSAKKCPSYRPNWLFRINLDYPRIHLVLGEKRGWKKIFELWENEFLCIYKSYYFLIANRGSYLDDKLFQKTQSTQEIMRRYYDYETDIEIDMDSLFEVKEEDEGYIYWVFKIQNGEFYQIIEHNTCE